MIREKDKTIPRSVHSTNASRELILFNDDHNTFEYVIESLIEVCLHEPPQAEQCALIAHYKGKCGIKTGPAEELNPEMLALKHRGLTVELH
jgi:ATP-dependent Clp protease adaptor protein ClpS